MTTNSILLLQKLHRIVHKFVYRILRMIRQKPFWWSWTDIFLGMADKFRKEIHLPKEILKDLKIVAAYADKSVKKYMEELIIQDVKVKANKLSRNTAYERK